MRLRCSTFLVVRDDINRCCNVNGKNFGWRKPKLLRNASQIVIRITFPVHRIADYQDPALRNATPCPLRAKPDAINPNSFRILPLTGSLRRLRRLPLHDGAQRQRLLPSGSETEHRQADQMMLWTARAPPSNYHHCRWPRAVIPVDRYSSTAVDRCFGERLVRRRTCRPFQNSRFVRSCVLRRNGGMD